MNLFEFNDYRDLISFCLDKQQGRGGRVKLAQELNCHPGYISQVFSKTKIHFSSENIIKISSFLKLDSPEEEFLMALHGKERAGSEALKKFWSKKIHLLREAHLRVEKQVKTISKDLSDIAKATYYSHWGYSAVHMVISIQHFEHVSDIAARLNLPEAFTNRILNFLLEHNLVEVNDGIYKIGRTRIHLKSDSPFVKSHHQNFRQKALTTLENENNFDLHYSAVLTLSKKDAIKIRQLLLNFIKEKEEILIPSENEDIVGLNLDLFKF